jgi:hypothetical protein
MSRSAEDSFLVDVVEQRRRDRRFLAGWILLPLGIASTLFFSMVVASTAVAVFGPEGCVALDPDAVSCSVRAAWSAMIPGVVGLVAGALVAAWGWLLARR